MNIDNTFKNFKTYEQFRSSISTQRPNKKPNIKKVLPALIGSAAGVGVGLLATKNINIKEKHHILDELIHLLAMAGGANVGSIVATSIGKKPEQIKKKIHEGAFQVMNTTIPMLMVSASNAICDKTIKKTKPVIRILASILAMGSGAAIATKITNATNGTKQPKRKYTLKDSIANVDDIVATTNIAFGDTDIVEKLKLDYTLMPFIYTYCGMRAGLKE